MGRDSAIGRACSLLVDRAERSIVLVTVSEDRSGAPQFTLYSIYNILHTSLNRDCLLRKATNVYAIYYLHASIILKLEMLSPSGRFKLPRYSSANMANDSRCRRRTGSCHIPLRAHQNLTRRLTTDTCFISLAIPKHSSVRIKPFIYVARTGAAADRLKSQAETRPNTV